MIKTVSDLTIPLLARINASIKNVFYENRVSSTVELINPSEEMCPEIFFRVVVLATTFFHSSNLSFRLSW
jgi:hypothetical protein